MAMPGPTHTLLCPWLLHLGKAALRGPSASLAGIKRPQSNDEPDAESPVFWNSPLVLGCQRPGDDFIQSRCPLLLLPVIFTHKHKLPVWRDYGEPSFPPLPCDSSGQASLDLISLLFASNKNSAQFKGILGRRKQDNHGPYYRGSLLSGVVPCCHLKGRSNRFHMEGKLPWTQSRRTQGSGKIPEI